MLRSYRGIILAAVGWLIVAAAPNQNRAANHQAEPAQSVEKAQPQAAPRVAPKAVEPVPPTEYYRPCEQPYSERQSDLCAQWKAADSANDAAYWAWWQFVISAFGLVGLIYTLRLTSKATSAAVAAVEGQITSDRPLMQAKSLSVKKAAGGTVKRPLRLHIEWQIANYGKTGCWIECINIQPIAGNVQPTGIFPDCDIAVNSFVAPGGRVETTGKLLSYEFSKSEENIIFGAQKIYIYGFIRYRDLGRRRWQTHFAFSVKLNAEYKSIAFHPIPSDEHWRDGRVEEDAREV